LKEEKEIEDKKQEIEKKELIAELRTSGNGYCDILILGDIWGNKLRNKNTLR